VLTHPWEVFVERWNWKAALLSAIFRSIAFAAPMAGFVGGDALRSLWIEMCFRIAVGGCWGSLLQEFRSASPGWLAGLWVAIVLPAIAHVLEYLALRAGHATHIKTGMIVSIVISIGSQLISLELMRRGILITGENSKPLRSDLRCIPGTLAGVCRGVSRRVFLGALASATVLRVCRSAEAERSQKLGWNAGAAPRFSLHVRYRADAQILAFGVRIFRREGVGEGSILWREFDRSGCTRLLEFTGFSVPERAAGLNGFGLLREIACVEAGASECLYFGLMTASAEENEEQALRTLHMQTGEQTYTAIDGRINREAAESATACFTAPATFSTGRCDQLVERAQRALATAQRTTQTHEAPACGQSFLQTLAALLMTSETCESRYLYSGRSYRIRISRSKDAAAAEQFRRRGLVTSQAEVLRIPGKVRREGGDKETEFRLWISDSGERPLPLRIEFQPKRYLKLTFEAETA